MKWLKFFTVYSYKCKNQPYFYFIFHFLRELLASTWYRGISCGGNMGYSLYQKYPIWMVSSIYHQWYLWYPVVSCVSWCLYLFFRRPPSPSTSEIRPSLTNDCTWEWSLKNFQFHPSWDHPSYVVYAAWCSSRKREAQGTINDIHPILLKDLTKTSNPDFKFRPGD